MTLVRLEIELNKQIGLSPRVINLKILVNYYSNKVMTIIELWSITDQPKQLPNFNTRASYFLCSAPSSINLMLKICSRPWEFLITL